jgi:hypothetical protein
MRGAHTYPHPIGPPTLGQHLSTEAVRLASFRGHNALYTLDPDTCALAFALRIALDQQMYILRDLVARRSDDDAWDHNWGIGYRAWLAQMQEVLDALDNLSPEPDFDA